MDHSLALEHALSSEGVADAWSEHPSWTLLRSSNSRWILPLFSQHLEQADAPVSADWFHQKIAETLAGQTHSPAADAPATPDADGEAATDSEDAVADPAGYCRQWVRHGWLIRSRSAGPEGRAHYRLSTHALKALRIVRELVEQDSVVSEARLGSIAHAVRHLAGMTEPDAPAQLARVDEQIAELQRRRERILTEGPEPVSGEALARQLREVVRLTAALPEDFRQLSAMVEQRHREVARRAALEQLGKGALVDRYLAENDLLEQTPEGRAYRGFAQMLSSREIDAMRADIERILAEPAAEQYLAEGQRQQLESLISSLLAEEQTVQESYGRWTSSLRRFLSRSGNHRHERLLTLAERALHAGGVWADAEPGTAMMPTDVLGIGGANIVDMSQAQIWRDRGRPEVTVSITSDAQELPDADRASLRLSAGTSPAAVEATIDRLLVHRSVVTAAEVYAASDAEFRRLSLVLSMLDHAVDRGVVGTEAETLDLAGGPAHGRRVRLPSLLFGTVPEDSDGPAAAPPDTPDLLSPVTPTPPVPEMRR